MKSRSFTRARRLVSRNYSRRIARYLKQRRARGERRYTRTQLAIGAEYIAPLRKFKSGYDAWNIS